METKVVYSVSPLSEMAGVSICTLYHYNSIGLLTPNCRSSNGYREYHREDLVLLQQIITYRELDFSLNSNIDIVAAN